MKIKTQLFLCRTYDCVFEKTRHHFFAWYVPKVVAEPALQPHIATYVVDMIRAMIENCADPHYPQERLDTLWARCDSTAFAEHAGITREEGKKIIAATRQALLEDMLTEPVTLRVDQREYTITKTGYGLHVERDEK